MTTAQFHPFVPNAPFLFTLKTPYAFPLCFQGVEKGCIRNEWVNHWSGRFFLNEAAT